MRPHGVHRALIIGLVGSCLALPARAQPVSQPAPSAQAASDSSGEPKAAPTSPPRDLNKVYSAAKRAREAGKFRDAYDGFKEVWAVQKKPKVAGNLGHAELKLGMYRDAAEHLEIFLREERDLGLDERKEAEAELAAAKAKVVTLVIEVSAPPGLPPAEVFVDNDPVATAPIQHEVYVTPVPHLIRARAGEATAQHEVDETPGSRRLVQLELKAPPKPARPPPPLPQPKPIFTTPVVVGVLGGLAAVAGFGVGIGAGVESQAKEKERNECNAGEFGPTRDERKQCYDDVEATRLDVAGLSTGGFVVGGAALLATAGILYFSVNSPAKAGRPLRVTPAFGGLVISGQW